MLFHSQIKCVTADHLTSWYSGALLSCGSDSRVKQCTLDKSCRTVCLVNNCGEIVSICYVRDLSVVKNKAEKELGLGAKVKWWKSSLHDNESK